LPFGGTIGYPADPQVGAHLIGYRGRRFAAAGRQCVGPELNGWRRAWRARVALMRQVSSHFQQHPLRRFERA